MSEVVRVAVAGSSINLNWPPRCPRCGARGLLVASTCRVGRWKFDRSGLRGGFEKRIETLVVSPPMCQRHADANDVANMILEDSPLMVGLRSIAWIALAKALLLVGGAVRHGGFKRHDLAALLLCSLIGLCGGIAIWWAAKNVSVQAKGFDHDMSVLKMWFADERYASDFRDANPADTDPVVTAPPRWFQRSAVWEIGATLLGLLWLARWHV